VKVTSPVGEYEYLVKRVRLDHGSVAIDGSLGVWETTMSIEPSDWLRLARRAAAPVALLAAVAAARRLRR
jgi:hypothetical protein